MNRRLKELFPPLRSFALMSLTAATVGGIQTSPCAAQGVWAESACGAEVVCGAEISGGAEPACGVEVSCGCERPYQPKSTCGCESSGSGELLGSEKGLLAHARLPRRGLIHGTLNVVAGGIEKIMTLRPHAPHASRATCGCSIHPHQITGQFAVTDGASCSHCQPTLATGVPGVSAEISMPSDSRTELEREWAAPPAVSDAQPVIDTDRAQPGATFDRLSDPFEDDSASNIASGKTAIMQTTYANEVRRSSPGRVSAAPRSNTNYADYFRK